MFERLRSYFLKVEARSISLGFELDLADDGRHIVHVFKRINGKVEPVSDIRHLWSYGYSEEIETDHQRVILTLKEEDRQTLLSLKSLNPEIKEDGSLVFEIEPPVLRYLRRKENLQESHDAQKVTISDTPLRPTVMLDYEPGVHIKVESGYAIEGTEGLIRPEAIKITRDGKYARIGNLFAPLVELSDKAREILRKPLDYVAVKDIPEFIQRDLVLLKKDFNAVLTDLAQQIQVITDPLEAVVRVEKDSQGWLNFQVSYSTKGFVLPIGLLTEKKDQKYFQFDNHTWVKFDAKQIEKAEKELDELGAVLTEHGYRLPAYEFASLEDFIADLGGRAELAKSYREFLDQLTGFVANEYFKLPGRFESHLEKVGLGLRPYQRAGVQWLNWLRSNHLQGILADDMGLGKTLQSLCALRLGYEETKSQQHSLIIAPKSVLYHWDRELRRCYPYIRSYIYHGSNRKTAIFYSNLPHVIFTTYDTITRDIDELSKVPFYYLILDEATRIKNPDAQRTQAIKALNAAHRLALSGTPIENRPTELWSLFDFLMRGHLGKYGTFVRKFEDSILAGDQRAAIYLGKRVRPFLLRRKKEAVAKDLPEKILISEWCSLTEEQKQLYGGLQDEINRIREALKRGEYVNYTTNILPVLTKLKQLCDHPALVTKKAEPLYGRSEKFDWIVEKIDEIVQSGEQVVVFSHFLNMLNLLEAAIREKKYTYIRIDGSTDQRQPLIDLFNQGGARVALLSLMAAGYGINLTAANHVIHADRWWNPAVEDQATDRVHRIGQNRTVFVYHILVDGTLEVKIDKLLEKKRGIADQIIGEAVKGTRQWTREELLEILKPFE